MKPETLSELNPKNKDRVIVLVIIGQKYLDSFNHTYRSSVESYAKKLGIKLVIIEEYLRTSDKHPSWQKLLMFDHPDLKDKKQALFLDADIYVTRHAKDPFEVTGNKPWSIALNNPYNLPFLAKTDPQLYECCPPENRPTYAVNTGVFVMTPEYIPLMEKIYRDIPEQNCRENGPLSYYLLNDNKGVMLPPEFNTIVFCYRFAHGWGLSKILKMYHESSFIHFAGNKNIILFPLIKYIDTHDNTLLKKLIYFFGKETFDPITSNVIKGIEKVSAVYKYHIKRRLQRSSKK